MENIKSTYTIDKYKPIKLYFCAFFLCLFFAKSTHAATNNSTQQQQPDLAKDHQEIVKYIRSKEKNLKEKITSILHKYPEKETRKQLLAIQSDLLVEASKYNRQATIKLLLTYPLDINQTDDAGQTALIWAASNGNVEIISLLLQAKADINHADNDRQTALIAALSQKKYLAVAALVKNKNLDLTKHNQLKILQEKIQNTENIEKPDQKKAIKEIRKKLKNLEKKQANNISATQAQFTSTTKQNPNTGTAINDTNNINTNPAQQADLTKYHQVLLTWIQAKTPKTSETEQAKNILKKECTLEQKQQLFTMQPSLLVEASKCDTRKTVKFLLPHTPNVNQTDDTGRTALIWAAINGNEFITDLFLVANADINHADKSGETALTIALKWGKYNIAALLLTNANLKLQEHNQLQRLKEAMQNLPTQTPHQQAIDVIKSKLPELEKNAPDDLQDTETLPGYKNYFSNVDEGENTSNSTTSTTTNDINTITVPNLKSPPSPKVTANTNTPQATSNNNRPVITTQQTTPTNIHTTTLPQQTVINTTNVKKSVNPPTNNSQPQTIQTEFRFCNLSELEHPKAITSYMQEVLQLTKLVCQVNASNNQGTLTNNPAKQNELLQKLLLQKEDMDILLRYQPALAQLNADNSFYLLNLKSTIESLCKATTKQDQENHLNAYLIKVLPFGATSANVITQLETLTTQFAALGLNQKSLHHNNNTITSESITTKTPANNNTITIPQQITTNNINNTITVNNNNVPQQNTNQYSKAQLFSVLFAISGMTAAAWAYYQHVFLKKAQLTEQQVPLAQPLPAGSSSVTPPTANNPETSQPINQ